MLERIFATYVYVRVINESWVSNNMHNETCIKTLFIQETES